MFIRYLELGCIVVAVVGQLGCGSKLSTNPNDYVGEYVFKPHDYSLGQFPNFIILRHNHSAVEVKYSKQTSDVKTMEETWYLFRGTGEQIVIAKRAYPIEKSGSSIRLTINDVGQYYEKVR